MRIQWNEFHRHLEDLLHHSPSLAQEQKAVTQIQAKNGELLKRCHNIVVDLEKDNTQQASRVKQAIVLLFSLFIVVIAASYVLVIAPVLKQIVSVIGNVNDGSEQLNTVAGELRSTSLNLSDAANLQASSLEQTSASMEEMAGMTSQNADFAKRAGEMANKTKAAIANGEESVIRMMNAMEQISTSSQRVQKIVRSISRDCLSNQYPFSQRRPRSR